MPLSRRDNRRDAYGFAPGLRLGIRGGGTARRHFRAEYGRAGIPEADPDLELNVCFAPVRGFQAAVSGGHKTVRWRVALRAGPKGPPLHASIELRGRPRGFGLSLIQGYFVEPLLSLAAPRSGHVLLPAAALEQDGGAMVVLGRSASGKSSLAMRALAAGRGVLGDDQVLLDPEGGCSPFPRRPRVYGDLAATAPAAYARLGTPARARLAGRRVTRRASRRFIDPPLALDPSAIARSRAPNKLPVRRVVLIDPGSRSSDLQARELDPEDAVAAAVTLLEAQRAHLRTAAAGALAAAFRSALAIEHRHLRAALAGLTVEEVRIPAQWGAAKAVAALADRLEIG